MSNNAICWNYWKLLPLSAAIAGATATLAAPVPAQAQPYGPDTCIQGYVWREARSGDTVCVTPAIRTSTAQQNAAAGQNVEPGGGAYGPNTCKQGFVWREAYGRRRGLRDTSRSSPGGRRQRRRGIAQAGQPACAGAAAPAEPVVRD